MEPATLSTTTASHPHAEHADSGFESLMAHQCLCRSEACKRDRLVSGVRQGNDTPPTGPITLTTGGRHDGVY